VGERLVLLITAAIGALGWVFTHVVDRVTESPTVEYKITEGSLGKDKLLEVRLVNVTRSTSFSTVRLLMTVPNGGLIKDVKVTPVEPAFEGDVEPHVYGRSADVTLERFMPGARFDIRATYSGPRRPALRASAVDTPIRLQKRGLETLFARYEVVILSGLALIWLILAITVGIVFARSKVEAGATATGTRA
jgi:hypothetical protein